MAPLSFWRNWPLRILILIGVLALLHVTDYFLNDRFNRYVVDIVMLVGINIILAVSLNLINGITGQFSLGHAGFMAVGAYTAAAFTVYAGPRLALPGWGIYVLSLVAAAVAAALMGLLVGLPSLRLRGDYLAIVTLGFGQIIIAIIVTIKELGESLGMSDVPTFANGSIDTAFQHQIQTNFVWLYAMVALCILTMRNLADSSLGRSMQAVREDEVAAEAVGVNTTYTKVLAFVISALWAGVAGGLYAHYSHSVYPADYDFVRSVQIVVMVVLGGLGSITGATIAAVLLRVMDEALRTMNGTMYVAIALVVLGAAVAWPHWRQQLRHNPLAWLRWLGWPVLMLCAVLFVFHSHRDWIESPSTPGNTADWMRYVVYSLILIALMLLRPQGLLGRNEFSWGLFRRRNRPGGGAGSVSDEGPRRTHGREPIDAGVQPSL
jgi:branched-chain amino acid transport system permease protein